MAAIYKNRNYGKERKLFKKKRFKSSSKKFIKKRIKIEFRIITFDVCSSPGSTGAFQVSSERLEMLQKEVEQIEPVLIPNPYNTFIRG